MKSENTFTVETVEPIYLTAQAEIQQINQLREALFAIFDDE